MNMNVLTKFVHYVNHLFSFEGHITWQLPPPPTHTFKMAATPLVTRSQVWIGSRSSKWHLMANNSLSIWKKRIVALNKDGVGYKNIAKTLKLSCSMVSAEVEGVGGQRVSSQTIRCTLWSAWLSSKKEASSKDNAQESPQTVCWRQIDYRHGLLEPCPVVW